MPASPKAQQHDPPAQGLLSWVQQAQPSPEETVPLPPGHTVPCTQAPQVLWGSQHSPRGSRHAQAPSKGPAPSQQQSHPGSTCDPIGSHHRSTGHSPSTPPNTQGIPTANCPPTFTPLPRKPKDALPLQQPTSRAHVRMPVWSRALGLQSFWCWEPAPANCERPVAAGWVSSSRGSRGRESTAGDQLTKRYRAATNQQGKPVHKSSKVLFQRDAESWSHPTLHFFFKIIPASSFCYFYCTIMH